MANDMEPNHFWVQQPDGRFVDEAVIRGSAFNLLGEAEAGMGIALADLTSDGRFELFITHLRGETNTMYVADDSA